ncbi:hypothetical protein FGG08_007372 [Glutinoglossum americanum]|uniref:Fucose-specific lectin n=1 Tax=Glutinoglossum americanum TaxID=1670608 RepID=A0A9P8HZF9_9PEZI|nr:hypothetical protein FGG08_007372 [Glutinoglossum americanum]
MAAGESDGQTAAKEMPSAFLESTFCATLGSLSPNTLLKLQLLAAHSNRLIPSRINTTPGYKGQKMRQQHTDPLGVPPEGDILFRVVSSGALTRQVTTPGQGNTSPTHPQELPADAVLQELPADPTASRELPADPTHAVSPELPTDGQGQGNTSPADPPPQGLSADPTHAVSQELPADAISQELPAVPAVSAVSRELPTDGQGRGNISPADPPPRGLSADPTHAVSRELPTDGRGQGNTSSADPPTQELSADPTQAVSQELLADGQGQSNTSSADPPPQGLSADPTQAVSQELLADGQGQSNTSPADPTHAASQELPDRQGQGNTSPTVSRNLLAGPQNGDHQLLAHSSDDHHKGLLSGPRIRRASVQRYIWILLGLGLFIVALAVIITLSVLLRPKATPKIALTVTTVAATSTPPLTDSGLDIAPIVLGAPFSISPQNETKLVYNSEGGKICIRTKSQSSWSSSAQCVEGANPKNNTPLTILDWLGGPSIYFFTNKNSLSGIDYIPKTGGWRLSSITNEKITAHNLSQIASCTWRNGTAARVYYQVPNKQVWEFGMDDYRDQAWRNGSAVGFMGEAVEGSGIGVTRWINNTAEVEELFFEVISGGIQGKMYAQGKWIPEPYSVNGAAGGILDGSSITATTVGASAGTVYLSYVAKSGFLELQTRGTTNVSTYGDFGSPNQIAGGDGHPRAGLTAIDSSGRPVIYFVNGRKLMELSSSSNSNLSIEWSGVEI